MKLEQELEQLYQGRLDKFLAQQKEKTKTIRIIGNIRVILFLVMVFLISKFIGSEFEAMYFWWSFLAALPIFAYLLQIHQKFIDQKSLLDQLIKINEKECAAIKTGQAQFEGGEKYDDPNHDFCSDLDLFGPRALFAFINRTSTAKGEELLASLFKQPFQEVESVLKQQEAVKILAPMIDFRQKFMANGWITEDTLQDINYLKEWADAPMAFLDSTFWKITRILLPAISLVALVYFMITLVYAPLLLMMLINFALLGIKGKYVGTEHTAIGKRQNILKMYVSLLNLSSQQDFGKSTTLLGVKKTAEEAESAFQKLSSIIKFFDQRLNIFVGLGLNLLILFDVQCLFALEAWKKKHKKGLGTWLDSVATLDSLISLATFYYNNPEFCFPQLEKSDVLKIESIALGHPLIAADTRICNDTSLGKPHHIYVVTGSNMAGKSTYLRSVAINLLLAQIGAPVCATTFKCSMMDIMTSMRVQDSISQHTSYFQAELLRLQHIIKTLKDKKPTFIILDEILKGTNSEDKLLGSQLLVRHFLEFNCLAMVATHDLELGNMEMELPNKIENLCFESVIENDELSFDYKLNKGIAKNKNATFLMRKMEII